MINLKDIGSSSNRKPQYNTCPSAYKSLSVDHRRDCMRNIFWAIVDKIRKFFTKVGEEDPGKKIDEMIDEEEKEMENLK